MQKVSPFLIAVMALSCVPREARAPREITPEMAASALAKAVSRNAFALQLTGFGKYRGTQGILALEGSFTLFKDSSLMRLTLHGPFGGVVSVVELPNQGPASLLFGVPDESIADSITSARMVGRIIMIEMKLGYDTAQVSLDGERVKSLSMWGDSFFFGDYRKMEEGLEFPFRVDYSGKDGRATLFFEEIRLAEGD
jgi:hypothetical protein